MFLHLILEFKKQNNGDNTITLTTLTGKKVWGHP